MATYNGDKYLNEQIRSILSQVGTDVRLKVYDDRSIDSTSLILKDFCKNDERVTYNINTEASGSAAKNFLNAILSLTDEEIHENNFFALSDQDDIWLENKLISGIQELIVENSDLYMSNLISFDESTREKSFIRKSFRLKKYDYLFEGGSAGCTYIFNKKFVLSLRSYIKNNYDKLFWKYFSHDWMIYFFARTNNFKVFIDHNAYIMYRIHDSNVHGQMNNTSLSALKMRLSFVTNGWYHHHAYGYLQLLPEKSKDASILRMYTGNIFSRLLVILIKNSLLMRSKRKLIKFILISLIPLNLQKENLEHIK